MKTRNNAASGEFENCDTTQNNLDFFLSSTPKVVKKSNSKKLKNSNQSSNLTTTNELDKKSLLDNSTQTPTDTSVTATNADDYTRNTAGGNARPTPISADFAENVELIKFVEFLLEATPEHKNAVEAALDILRYANKHRFLSNTELFLEAFFVGLAKLNVPKEIIKLTTPILCEVLPNTTQELVERGLNNANIDSSFDLKFFENPDYKSDNDNFAGKYIANSWLEMLNNENRLKFEPCEVLEMPAAEPEISQATGTHGDLPTQKSASIIDNAEAGATATANNEIYSYKKGMTPERNLKMIISQQANNNNAENDTNAATDATNSASNIKTPPANNNAENATEIAHNGENNQISNNAPTATKQAEKSKTSNKKPKFEYKYYSTGEKIADALQYLDNENYGSWWQVLDAAKGAGNGGDAYKNIVENWSRPASNYNSKKFEEKWRAVKGEKNQAYIYKHAAENGWKNLPAADENNYYYFNSNQNSKNFSNQNSNNKKENANNNAVTAEVKNKAKYILSQAKEYTNNHFDALKNHYYFKHLTNFHNVYLNYYKEQISAVIPQFDINTIKNNDVSTAEVISLQFIFFKDDGTTDKRPLTGGSKHFTYFECCKEAAKEPKDIFFGEGVRTCLAAATALKGEKILIVCCLDAGNLVKVATKFKTLFPAANFGFLADNDIKENGKNVGVESAFQAAKEIKASLFIPNYLSDLPPEKCDFYDVLKHYNENPFDNKNGVAVIKEILKNDCFSKVSNEISNLINNKQIKEKDFTYFDDNGNAFHCSNTGGLIVIENTGKTDENGDIITNKIKLLNKPFFVVGEFFDKVKQNNHGYIIEFKNIAGTLQRMPVKSADLATDAVKSFNFLFANGLKKITTKITLKNLCEKYLLSYLNCFNFEKNLFNYTNKSGWQGDCCDVYIRPAISDAEEIYFGENENNKYFYENTNNQITFTAKGTFAEWKENVGKYIKGNPLLIVALLQCLTGFFLKELKFNDCIHFNFVGLSSSGKSVLFSVCRSLISGKDMELSWGGSISGVENVLKQFNHCFIPIDELTKIDEKELKSIVKVIYSNTGRMLSTRSGNSNREIKRWLLTGLSTSEKTLKEIAQQYKYNTMDGQEVRFIDIEFANLNYKYGVFKTVAEPTGNNTTDGQIFAKMLRDNSNTFYGTPMIELLKYLTAPSSENNNVKNITKIHSYLSFVEKNLNLCKNYFPVTLNRIASYFNNLIAVGSMLSKDGDFGLLPVEKCDILNAVLEVFNLVENKFKNDDGSYTTCTGANIYQNLTSFILQNENRFRPRLKPEIGDFFEPDKCAGYYDLVGSNTQGKNKIYYIFPDIFENEIAKDIPKKTALRELEKLGYIQKGRIGYKAEIRFYNRTSGSSENRIKLYKFENLFK